MRHKYHVIFLLSLLGLSSCTVPKPDYALSMNIYHNDKLESAHVLQLVDDEWTLDENGQCVYSVKILKQQDKTLLIDSNVECADFTFQPSFTLIEEGGQAAMVIGTDENYWRFAIDVKI